MKRLLLVLSLLFSTATHSTTLVVPYPPGGTVDLVARLVGKTLVEQGTNVVIENRAGAEGRVAYSQYARAKPQPNVLLMGASGPMFFAPLLTNEDVGYNTATSFVPVIHMGKAYHFILAHPNTGISNIKQLIQANKKYPDRFNYASGNATSRFMLEYFFRETKSSGQIIPYNGGGPAFIAMISGYVPFGAETTPSAVQHIKSGRLRALAITSVKRIPQAPEVPTVAETLKTNFEVYSTYTILGNSETPVQQYNALFNAALNDPELRKKFYDIHIEITGGTPDFLRADIEKQMKQWKSK